PPFVLPITADSTVGGYSIASLAAAAGVQLPSMLAPAVQPAGQAPASLPAPAPTGSSSSPPASTSAPSATPTPTPSSESTPLPSSPSSPPPASKPSTASSSPSLPAQPPKPVSRPHDKTHPVVNAFAGSGTLLHALRLRFRVSDNSGKAALALSLYKGNRTIAWRTIALKQVSARRTYSLTWKPQHLGDYLFCVGALDAAG